MGKNNGFDKVEKFESKDDIPMTKKGRPGNRGTTFSFH
jgi:hypothetical protein